MDMIGGRQMKNQCRKIAIVVDAAYEILTSSMFQVTGQAFIDERVLRNAGVIDFTRYSFVKGSIQNTLSVTTTRIQILTKFIP